MHQQPPTEPDLEATYDTKILTRLLSYLKPHLLSFIGSLLLAVGATGTELGLPYMFKMAIDDYITPFVKEEATISAPEALNGLIYLALLYGILLVGRLLLMYGQKVLLYVAGQNAMKDLRHEIFQSLMFMPVDEVQKHPVGRLVTRATNDVEAINEMYSEVLVALIKDIVMVIGLLTVMLFIDVWLTLLLLLLAPVTYQLGVEFRKRVRKAYRAVRRNVSNLNSYVAEHLSGMRISQMFAAEDRSRTAFEKVNHREYESRMRQLKIYGVFRPLVYFIRILATAIVLWVGGFRAIHSPFTFGSLVLFLSYIEKLFKPIQELSQKYDILQKAMASAERIFSLLDQSEENYGGRSLPAPSRGQGGRRIEFENVWFRYHQDSDDDNWILRDVCLTIEPGERIAIVGPTGAGKSTLIKLLLRWHDVQKGCIRVDGEDIRDLDLKELRSTFGVVLQDVHLFSGDVNENLRLWSEDLTDEDLEMALSRVEAEPVFEQLPNGRATNIKQKGEILAEGHRQLLSFARALAHNPSILLLDEATARLDSRTEQHVLSAMESMFANRTSITVAHRLSSIEESDRIYVLNNGQVVERGTHESLMERDQLYASLYRLQTERAKKEEG